MFSIPEAAWLPLWAVVGLHLMVLPAQASPAAAPAVSGAAPQAADPQAPVPAAPYRSPFTGYQAFSASPVAPWRDTNEQVRQRGGWRAYAREASEPASAPPSAAAPVAAPAAVPPPQGAGHSGHPMK